MNRKRIAIASAVILLVGGSATALIPPMIEWSGKRNTDYGDRYSDDQFDRTRVGMSADIVQHQLGEPVSRTINSDYPVWALREDSVREQLGRDKTFDMEVWTYSEAKDSRQDYELIHIAFGPGKEVIDKARWITD